MSIPASQQSTAASTTRHAQPTTSTQEQPLSHAKTRDSDHLTTEDFCAVLTLAGWL